MTYTGQNVISPDIRGAPITKIPSQPATTPPRPDSHVGAIVGGVLGGLGVLALIIVAVLFCLYRERRRKRQESQAAAEQNVAGTQHPPGPGPSGYGPVAQGPMQQAPPQPQYYEPSKVSQGDPNAMAGTPLPAYHQGSYTPLPTSDNTVPLPSPDVHQLDGQSVGLPPTAVSPPPPSVNSEAHLSGVQPGREPIYEAPGSETRR